MTEQRIVEIETKLAFQEETIKELSSVIYEQQKEIAALRGVCDQLRSMMQSFSDGENGPDPREERPPHY